MKTIIKCLTLGCVVATFPLFANSFTYKIVGGGTLSDIAVDNSVSVAPGGANIYTSTQGTQKKPFVGAGIEYHIDQLFSAPLTLGMGVMGYYFNLGQVSGAVTPAGSSDTLNYHFHVQSGAIMLEPRLIFTQYRIQPYIFGGVGAAGNDFFEYSAPTAAGSPFADYTKFNFAYEAGVGLQYLLTQSQQGSFVLGLEYRYFNLGKGQLGLANGQSTNDHLTSKNITLNSIDLAVSYQFN